MMPKKKTASYTVYLLINQELYLKKKTLRYALPYWITSTEGNMAFECVFKLKKKLKINMFQKILQES